MSTLEIGFRDQLERYKKEMVRHETCFLDTKGTYVAELVARWGMVIGVLPDNDPSRKIYDLMTEEQVVERAFKMTDLLFAKLYERDYIVTCPSMDEIAQMKEDD